MMNEKMQNALNEQINKEFYSEFLYLAMKAYFAELNLQGFVNWFDVQVQEPETTEEDDEYYKQYLAFKHKYE